MTTKAVLYARVSSERQDTELSIAAQLKALRTYAHDRGYEIIKEFVDEAESGRTVHRPLFQEMIGLARRKPPPFTTILVWKLSRFARNREDSIIYKSLLRRYGVQVVSINEPVDNTPSGKMMEGMIEVIDEFYSSNLAQEVARGMREAASRGYWVCAVTPFGYRRVRVQDNGRSRIKLEVDPNTAPTVRRMFQMIGEGLGVKEVAKALNGDGVPSPRGKAWGKSGVHNVLRNEMYTGILVWGAKGAYHQEAGLAPIRVAGAVPEIVSTDIFRMVQAELKRRSPKISAPRSVGSRYLLSGILRCGACNATMFGVSAKSGRFHYYVCSTAWRSGRDACPEQAVRVERLDAQVLENVCRVILTEKNLREVVRLTNEELARSLSQFRERLGTIERQTSDVDTRLRKLYEALETGKLELGDLAPRIRELRAQRELLERARDEVAEALDEGKVTLVDREEVLSYLDQFHDLLQEGTIAERRKLLRSFVESIVKQGKAATIHYTVPIELGRTETVLSFEQSGGRYWIRTSDPFLVREML